MKLDTEKNAFSIDFSPPLLHFLCLLIHGSKNSDRSSIKKYFGIFFANAEVFFAKLEIEIYTLVDSISSSKLVFNKKQFTELKNTVKEKV